MSPYDDDVPWNVADPDDPGASWDEADARQPDLKFEADVKDGVYKLTVAEEVKRRHAANTISEADIPVGLDGADFLAADYGENDYIIEGLLPKDGNVLLAAQRKAGKTTLVMNAIRSLADGDDFLDHFPVTRTRRVAFVDLEISDRMAQTWLRQQGIANVGGWRRYGLRGRAATFNILDDRVRSLWAARLAGTEALVVDPIRPVLDALRLKEATEVGVLLEALDALKAEAGISELIVVQHMGWDGEHTRGDSRQEDWPDTILKLRVDDPDDLGSFRYLRGIGRDADIPEGLVSMYEGRRLVYSKEAAREAKSASLVTLIVAYVKDHPGCNSTDLENVKGVDQKNRAKLVRQAEEAGKIRVEKRGTSNLHWPA